MHPPRLAWMVLLVGAAIGGALVALPAHADTLMLLDGGLLTGEVQGDELSMTTRDGATKLGLRDLREVTLNTIGGDVVRDAGGQTTTGLVEQPTYAIRLGSGQTVIVPRSQVAIIRVRPR